MTATQSPSKLYAAQVAAASAQAGARRDTEGAARPSALAVRADAASDELSAQTEAAITLSARHARLAYDQIESRAFVEILNPQTGDLLYRFPPEEAASHLADFASNKPGQVVDHKV